MSNRSSVTVEFSVEILFATSSSVAKISSRDPPKVFVHLKTCPWIFKLNETNGCDCAPVLRKNSRIQCSISDKSFHRGSRNVWVGCLYHNRSVNNESVCDEILLTKNCPEEFCSDRVNWLRHDNIDDQCKGNRSREGVLCGRCWENHSLTLGQPSCVHNDECPIWRLLVLLLVFGLAGILLVLFLAVFNFTVSQGTMYGLLFYAGVVHANQKSFICSCYGFFHIFVAWVNLDFGFKVCFYKGMDAYQKVWLEFAFIFYLLFLAVLIVYLSHKFIFVTTLVGRNVINVLSTILFLLCTKAARTAIKALHYIDLSMSSSVGESKIRVWYSDGNIDYLQGKHIPLALVSIAVVAVVFLYMLCLLFIQCLQRGSGWCVLRWVNKLRPLFDANTGPCSDRYRFWPGFLLFCLLSIFTMQLNHSSTGQLHIALAFCVLMFVLACISPRGVYKKWPLNVLEFTFLLNLSSLCVFVSVDKDTVFSGVSLGISVTTFVLIVIFHGYQRVSGTRKWQKLIRKARGKRFTNLRIRKTKNLSSSEHCMEATEQLPYFVHRVNFTDLRESLLSSGD